MSLVVAEGRDEVVGLHGMLRDHLRAEHLYVPHVGLGLLIEERDAGAEAKREGG